MIQPVILCGGSATRPWPLSPEYEDPLVICSEGHRFMVDAQLRRAGRAAQAILLAPVDRGTAPALTLAAVHALSADDPVLVALPSDLHTDEGEAVHLAVQRGATLAGGARIVVFGVPASAPGTGRGYIRADGDYVEAFLDQPDSGSCLCNAGILAVRASVWIDAIGASRHDILKACERAWREARREGAFRRIAELFGRCPSASIECAVMESVRQGGPEARVVRLEDDIPRFEESYDRIAAAAATR